MKQTFILFLLLFGYLPATAQYCGLDAPITLPAATDSFVLDFLINDIQNDNLASPDQGVCRVDLFFLTPPDAGSVSREELPSRRITEYPGLRSSRTLSRGPYSSCRIVST